TLGVNALISRSFAEPKSLLAIPPKMPIWPLISATLKNDFSAKKYRCVRVEGPDITEKCDETTGRAFIGQIRGTESYVNDCNDLSVIGDQICV
ncbi:MAG: hypothetical protein AAFW66_13605, partial [Pseudomonadota bacterium]